MEKGKAWAPDGGWVISWKLEPTPGIFHFNAAKCGGKRA